MAITSGATPSELKGLNLDAGGNPIPPKQPTLTKSLKALGVTGFLLNTETNTWEPVMGGQDKPVDPNGPGGPKKAPDPYAPIMRSFFSAYFKIWGTLPPPGYVEGAARSMNLYEFIDQERKKPAYRHTKAYKNEAAKYAALRDQLLGYY